MAKGITKIYSIEDEVATIDELEQLRELIVFLDKNYQRNDFITLYSMFYSKYRYSKYSLKRKLFNWCEEIPNDALKYFRYKVSEVRKEIAQIIQLSEHIEDLLSKSNNKPIHFYSGRWSYKGNWYQVEGKYSNQEAELLIMEEFDREKSEEASPEIIYLRHRIPEQVRNEVWRRDGGKCVKCGSRENLEYDHILPISKGGSNTARNIELLCEKCNRSKGADIQ